MALPKEKHAEPQAPRDYDEITYVPGEGSPARTTWNGKRFEANKPVQIKRTATVEELIREEREAPDGTIVTRAVPKRVPMVELAKLNPEFSVNGATPIAKKDPVLRLPDNPDQYRSFAMRWITGASTLEELTSRWAAEAPLREKCGVNDQDVAWLTPFYDGRKEMLSDAA